jgi:hypothetical protein
MKGFMDGILAQIYEQKLGNLSKAVALLMWGSKRWKDVSSDDRGAIFDPTFIYAARKMYFMAILEVCMTFIFP